LCFYLWDNFVEIWEETCICINLTQLEIIVDIFTATTLQTLQTSSKLLGYKCVAVQTIKHFLRVFSFKNHIRIHTTEEEILLMKELKSTIKLYTLCLHVNQFRKLLAWDHKHSFTLPQSFINVTNTQNRLVVWDLNQVLTLTRLKKKNCFYNQEEITAPSGR